MDANKAGELAYELRRFADFLDIHAEELPRVNVDITSHVWGYMEEQSVPESVALAMRAGLKDADTVEKEYADNYFRMYLSFGALKYKIVCNRDEVCERKVVGTEMVTEKVAPAGEWTEQTVEKDVVEWVCNPLLAIATDA
jgi:molybdate-binding protein